MTKDGDNRSSLESQAYAARARLSRTLSSLERRRERLARSAKLGVGFAGALILGSIGFVVFELFADRAQRLAPSSRPGRAFTAVTALAGLVVGAPLMYLRRRALLPSRGASSATE